MERLALLGGQPIAPTMPTWPVRDEREEQVLIDVLRSGVYGGFPEPAPHAARFSADFAAMHDAAYGIACMNGTITMITALMTAGIGWGDEVIIPSLTFAATAYAPLSLGAVPIICDVDLATLCIDPAQIEAAITERTRAIIPVHLASTIADMEAIMALAERHNLIVLEDCAHAHGGQWCDKGAGSWGHFGSFSMQLTKTLTSGEGGLITTSDPEYAEACHSIIDCGRPKDPDKQRVRLGANYRLTEFQAALLEVGLTRLLDQTATRGRNMAYADERLGQLDGVTPQKIDPRVTRRPGYMYLTRFEPEAFGGLNSQQVTAALAAEGFPCGPGNPPMHRYDLFQLTDDNSFTYRHFKDRLNFADMSFPVAERASQTTIWTAHQLFLGETDLVDQFVEAIEKVRDNAPALRDYRDDVQAGQPAHLRT